MKYKSTYSVGAVSLFLCLSTSAHAQLIPGLDIDILLGNVTIGVGADVPTTNGVAIGRDSESSASAAIAIGQTSSASSAASVAIGATAQANGTSSLAIGNAARATLAGDVAIGSGAVTGLAHLGIPGIHGGTVAGTTLGGVLSVGTIGSARQIQNVGAGLVSALSTDAVNGSQLFSVSNALTNVGSSLQSVIGGGATVAADGSVTLPNFSVNGTAFANVGAALGALDGSLLSLDLDLDLLTTEIENGTIGIVQQDGGSPGVGTIRIGATTGGTVVSLSGNEGNRVLIGAAPGNLSAVSSDAVNGGQVNRLAASVSSVIGNSTFNPASGQVASIGFGSQGRTYATVADALAAIVDDVVTINNTIATGSVRYLRVNSTLADSSAPGQNAIAIGPASIAGTDNSIAIGNGAQAASGAAVAIGLGQFASGNGAVAIGDPNSAAGTGALAIGADNSAMGNGAVALGNANLAAGTGAIAIGSNSSALTAGAVALGNGAVAGAAHSGAYSINGGTIAGTAPVAVASIGSAGNERQLQNVAAGVVSAGSTDAINGSQLYAVASAVNAQGTQIATVDANLNLLTNIVNNIGGGGGGGGNPNALLRTGGTMSGAIDMGGNAIANLAGPVNAGDAANKAYVDNVAASAASTSASVGTSVAAALGGGSAYDAGSGQVSAPSYAVGGRSYSSIGDAFAATNLLAVQYTADANGQPTNAIVLRGNGSGQPVAISNIAAGAVGAGSSEAVNGAQLYAVQQVADGALQRSGGTMSGGIDMGGNRISNAAAPQDANDVATKGYVDSMQGLGAVQLAGLTNGLNTAFGKIERNGQGVALAMAMGGGYLEPESRFALFGGWGNFDGHNALAAQSYVRVSRDVSLNAGLSVGLEEGLVGTRIGFGVQF